MKINYIVSVLVLGGALFLNSCDDDETPKSGITFELAEQEVTESDGTAKSLHPDLSQGAQVRAIPVKLVFDRPLAKNAVLKFDIDGTARETKSSTTSELNDFELLAEGTNVTIANDEITILKGASEATINVRIFEDGLWEYDADYLTANETAYETIDITIESVVSGPIKLGTQLTHTLKVLEDDTFVFLGWNPADQDDAAGSAGDVNMDLFIYFNNRIFNYSNDTNEPYEVAIIPAGISNGTISFSYVYKGGTSNDLDFLVSITNFGGTLTKADGTTSGRELEFTGKYELDNLNSTHTVPAGTAAPNSKIIQTMTKSGFNYTGLTEMSIPATSSRTSMKSTQLITPSLLKKMKVLKSIRVIEDF